MHVNSMEVMSLLIEKYSADMIEQAKFNGSGKFKVADIGSYNVNGSYRKLIENKGWNYCGVDITPGPNVDIVVDEYSAALDLPFAPDLIISGSCIEHCKNPFKFVDRLGRAIAHKSYIIVTAPWNMGIHRYPIDCWRILPDGYHQLASDAKLNVIEAGVRKEDAYVVYRKL